MLARCPTCRQTFSTEKTGAQDCPHCHKPLLVPEPPHAQLVGLEPGGQAPPPSDGTPWERRAELGFLAGWWQTVWQALFEPAKLFESARIDLGRAQLGFAVLTGGVFWGLSQIINRLLQSVMPSQADQIQQAQQQLRQLGAPPVFARLLTWSAEPTSMRDTVLIALFSPIATAIFLYANAGITHAAALMLGQARRGFDATFAACAYGVAPAVLMIVPGCGGAVATIWCIVLIGVGLKHTHQIKPGGAAAAVLAPYVVLCCFGCAAAVAVVSLFGPAVQKAMSGGH